MGAKFNKLKNWLSGLSFRTGLIVLGCCIPCYLLSFGFLALDINLVLRGILWAAFFGLAKTFQYGGLLILGKEGISRLKAYWRRKSSPAE